MQSAFLNLGGVTKGYLIFIDGGLVISDALALSE